MPFSVRKYPYGNLQAYKMYIRPNLYQVLYGASYQKSPKNKHAENVIRLLAFLAKNRTCTTWEIAKDEITSDIQKLRTREKEYRRLIIGRNDKKRHNSGLLELGLVVQDGISHSRAPAAKYRLSLHGILVCIDVLDLTNDDIDMIATNYSKILPKVFGRWELLKSNLGEVVYKFRILSRGIISDNMIVMEESESTLFEIMSFVHTKYKAKLENIEEEELAEQISFWFYTNLLYHTTRKKNKTTMLAKILDKDKKLKKWYNEFLAEVKDFHKVQYYSIKQFKIS